MRSYLQAIEANIFGKLVKPKILVIESDDWGSIRTFSKKSYDKLGESYPEILKSDYLRYDCLENDTDLNELFKILRKHKDSHGLSAKITANTVMTNPDFSRIKDSNFENYYYQSFTETLEERDGHDRVRQFYMQGIDENLFYPQFHGREHVNIELWLSLLKSDKMFRDAFDLSVWGISRDLRPDIPTSIQATYDTGLDIAKESIASGLNLFEEIFGYRSKTFIANNFIWASDLEKTLSVHGVEYLQGMKYQFLPLQEGGKRERIRHWFGQTNEFGQTYGIRNCSLELTERLSTVESCVKEVAMAFAFRKPAIVSMHRLNFMGGLDPANRTKGLEALDLFLANITKRFPDIRFMTTPELHAYLTKA